MASITFASSKVRTRTDRLNDDIDAAVKAAAESETIEPADVALLKKAAAAAGPLADALGFDQFTVTLDIREGGAACAVLPTAAPVDDGQIDTAEPAEADTQKPAESETPGAQE